MFCQFITNQMESSLLESVDQIVDREIIGRFIELGGGTDPHVASITQMSTAVLNSVEGSVVRQAEIWERSLREAQTRWDEIMRTAGSNIEVGLEAAFRRSIQAHAEELVRSEEAASIRTDRRFESLQQTLKENAVVMQHQQSELTKQGDLMLQAINATGEVAKVQNALNENMRSLSLMGKFDETVMSLSAAINLLNARLGSPKQNSQRVRLYQQDDRRAA
jgi:hypothetical protein